MPIRVVLAEDSLLVREGVRRLLELRPDVEVVAACGDLDALLEAVEAERPDVVLTDIRMPPDASDEGIRAARELRETHPELGVVVLSQYAEPGYALALLEGGSERRAYLLKDRVDDVDAAGRRRSERSPRGGSMIDPKIVEALVAARARGRALAARRADAARARRAARDGGGQEQRGDRGGAGRHRALGREVRALDLRQARTRLGGQRHRRVKAVLLYLAERRLGRVRSSGPKSALCRKPVAPHARACVRSARGRSRRAR